MTKPKPINGFLNIDKPAGITSYDVIRSLKRLTRSAKIGYIGTLDPIATGALPIGIGKATRLISYLEKSEKLYHATARLGSSTDTHDKTGQIEERADPEKIEALTRDEIEHALKKFIGRIEQRAPAFSAKKSNGRRLYRLAREGRPVEPEPSSVEIKSIELVKIDKPDITFIARCSTGTYIRALARDIGLELGVFAHLAELRRLASGSFRVEESHPLDQIDAENLESRLISMSDGLCRFPSSRLSDGGRARAGRGSMIGVSDVVAVEGSESDDSKRLTRLIDARGELIGVGQKIGPPLAGFDFAEIRPLKILI